MISHWIIKNIILASQKAVIYTHMNIYIQYILWKIKCWTYLSVPENVAVIFDLMILKHISVSDIWFISSGITLSWIPQALIDDESMLVQAVNPLRLNVIAFGQMQLHLHKCNYTPAQRSWRGGILDSPCPSVRLSVRLSVDDMVSGA